MKLRTFDNIGESLYSETLPNGLTVHVAPKTGYNKSCAMFAANYGGADRRFRLGGEWIDTPAGVAHFLEHKMFDTPDGGNALSVLSSNGASPNAFTSTGITAYHFESTQGFEENLRTLLDFVSVPYFTAESVEKEQGIIGQEIDMVEDSPGYVVYFNLLRLLFENNPIRDSIVGTAESIGRITDKTLYDCHKVFYNPSNMVLTVAGGVDPERVRDIALEILPPDPGETPERDYGAPEPEFPARQLERKTMEVAAPLFVLGSRLVPAAGLPRLRQKLTADIALGCLIGRSSPFYLKLYADGLLNNSFGFELDYSAGAAMVMLDGESVSPERVRDALTAEVEKITKSGLDKAAFARMKKSVYGRRLRSLDAFGDLCRELADGQFAGYCPHEAFSLMDGITQTEAEDFITANLSPAKLALSIAEKGM